MSFLKKESDLALTSSHSTVYESNTLSISALRMSEKPIIIPNKTEDPTFCILTVDQAQQVIQKELGLIALAQQK